MVIMLKTIKIKTAMTLLLTSALVAGNAFCSSKFDLLKYISKDSQMVLFADVKAFVDNPAVSAAVNDAVVKGGSKELAEAQKAAAKHDMKLDNIVQEFAACGGTSDSIPFFYMMVKFNYPQKKLIDFLSEEKEFKTRLSIHNYKGKPLYMVKDVCSIFFVTDKIAMIIPDLYQVHEAYGASTVGNFFKNKDLVSYYKKVNNNKAWMVLRPDANSPAPGGIKKALAAFDIKGNSLALLFKLKMNDTKKANELKNSYAMFKMMATAQLQGLADPKAGKDFINKLKVNFSKDMISGAMKFNISELKNFAEQVSMMAAQRMVAPQQKTLPQGNVHKF